MQGMQNIKSHRHTVKNLEEVSVSSRGLERIQLLRRWLVALREIEKISGNYYDDNEKKFVQNDTSNESNDSPGKPNLVSNFTSAPQPVMCRIIIITYYAA